MRSSCASALDAQRLRDEIAWFAPDLRVALLPDWETLPYDSFSPHHDLVSERLATLYRITTGDFDVAIVPATTALQRLAPPSYLAGYTFFIKQGARLERGELRAQLATAGYSHVTQVVAPGEYCIRGGLIDLFPMGSALPYRIDLVDDEIESLRTFDVDTQRTVYKVNEVRLLPAREFPLDDAGAAAGFRARFREAFEGDPSKSPVYKDVSNGVAPAGIEYYLPLFFDRHRHAVRLPAAGDDARHPSRRARRDRGVLARRAVALPAAATAIRTDRCCRPPRSLPVRRGVLRRRQGLRAARSARAAARPRRRRPAWPPAPLPPVAVERRADDPLAGAQALPRRDAGARAARRRIARAPRDDGRLPRAVRPAAAAERFGFAEFALPEATG